jgi:hypothetical protein
MRFSATYRFDRSLWTVVDYNKVDFANIQTFFTDARSDKAVVVVLLELVNDLHILVSVFAIYPGNELLTVFCSFCVNPLSVTSFP